jgi:hypothetical protein
MVKSGCKNAKLFFTEPIYQLAIAKAARVLKKGGIKGTVKIGF